MSNDIAELFLKGRITEEEALDLVKSRRQLDKEIDKSCRKQGIALTTMKYDYGNVRRRGPTKYRA